MGAGERLRHGSGRERISSAWDAVRTSFGFLTGVGMVLGLALGLGLPAVDEWLGIDLPVLSFESQSSARSLLETIGTTTVAVAGLSFSVTIVAFTLASSQLSPRVLRSFRSDRLSQATLGILLGTFIYCLTLLVRLGVSGEGAEPPNLSVTLAVVLAFAAFALFAAFIAHIVDMLQPSSVIEAIRGDASAVVSAGFPSGSGEPEDDAVAAERAERVMRAGAPRLVEAEAAGYLTLIDVGPLLDAADSADALVRQAVPVGSYVLPEQPLAELWLDSDEGEERLVSSVRAAFDLGRQRTMVQDVAFPVRQLADIALRGLSPGVNDPTTAENAIDALTAVLIEYACSDRPSPVRVGPDGAPRLVALSPELGDLVRLGFEQVRISAGPHPGVSLRLLELLSHLERVAEQSGAQTAEIGRQRRLIVAGAGDRGPTETDLDRVRRAGSGPGTPE